MDEWIYETTIIKEATDIPINCIGFIYMIENISNGKKYIGRKILKFKKTKPPLKGLKRKRVSYVESDWKTYIGSNQELINDAARGHQLNRYILRYCYTKKQLSYYELKYQIMNDVLCDENFYNSNILGKFFKKDI